MLKTIETYLAAHPAVRGALWMLLVGALGALYNWVTYKRTPEAWAIYEVQHPRKAAFIRVMRIAFPHLRKLLPALAALLPPPPPPSDKKENGTS